MVFLLIVVGLVILAIDFWAGARYGGKVWSDELVAERKLKALIIKERNELKANLDIARRKATELGLDARKIFPWLALILCIALGSCGPQTVYAQVVKPALTSAAPLPSGTFWSPERNLEALDVAALESARTSIDLAAFSLTDQAVVTALKDRAAHGVQVRIYLDRGELQSECRDDVTCARIPLRELIGLPGVEIRVKFSKVLMHLKSYEVDNWLVRDGSANFSEQGEAHQDNSVTFGSKNPEFFTAKFSAMWTRPDNLTVAQAVKANK